MPPLVVRIRFLPAMTNSPLDDIGICRRRQAETRRLDGALRLRDGLSLQDDLEVVLSWIAGREADLLRAVESGIRTDLISRQLSRRRRGRGPPVSPWAWSAPAAWCACHRSMTNVIGC